MYFQNQVLITFPIDYNTVSPESDRSHFPSNEVILEKNKE